MARIYISKEVERRVRAAAHNRCGYCLSPQHLVMARLEIEHIIPLSKQGSNDESNLWLACPLCNRYKGDKTTAVDPKTGKRVPLFNPRRYGLNIFSGQKMTSALLEERWLVERWLRRFI